MHANFGPVSTSVRAMSMNSVFRPLERPRDEALPRSLCGDLRWAERPSLGNGGGPRWRRVTLGCGVSRRPGACNVLPQGAAKGVQPRRTAQVLLVSSMFGCSRGSLTKPLKFGRTNSRAHQIGAEQSRAAEPSAIQRRTWQSSARQARAEQSSASKGKRGRPTWRGSPI